MIVSHDLETVERKLSTPGRFLTKTVCVSPCILRGISKSAPSIGVKLECTKVSSRSSTRQGFSARCGAAPGSNGASGSYVGSRCEICSWISAIVSGEGLGGSAGGARQAHMRVKKPRRGARGAATTSDSSSLPAPAETGGEKMRRRLVDMEDPGEEAVGDDSARGERGPRGEPGVASGASTWVIIPAVSAMVVGARASAGSWGRRELDGARWLVPVACGRSLAFCAPYSGMGKKGRFVEVNDFGDFWSAILHDY